jgi:hypothetical protein
MCKIDKNVEIPHLPFSAGILLPFMNINSAALERNSKTKDERSSRFAQKREFMRIIMERDVSACAHGNETGDVLGDEALASGEQND